MKITRTQENYIIMTIVYEALVDFSVHKNEAFRTYDELVSEDAVASIVSELDEEIDYVKTDEYINNSVNLTLLHYADICNLVQPALKNWAWERIPLLTQAIIITAVSHYYYVEKINKKIVIDVAINEAKRYVEEKQAKFIHALLDEVIK